MTKKIYYKTTFINSYGQEIDLDKNNLQKMSKEDLIELLVEVAKESGEYKQKYIALIEVADTVTFSKFLMHKIRSK